jgi:maltose/moltooligosaccharide transporter
MAFALLLAFYTSRYSINRRLVHGVSLAIGGLGFAWMLQLNADSAAQLKWCFACIGVAWGSILSMPYAMLSSSVPKDQMGIYMGIFNIFIVIPQILAALGGINWVNGVLFDGNIAFTMMIAGLSLGAGALSLVLVDRSVH